MIVDRYCYSGLDGSGGPRRRLVRWFLVSGLWLLISALPLVRDREKIFRCRPDGLFLYCLRQATATKLTALLCAQLTRYHRHTISNYKG